ncbi:HNH endonuclease [Bifidobacterium sp. ESL0690]|uniref:HNH endonuclease n=1 Tax=Bifidobacterium sp. ESL0690 TaxID=2983214 RepID=UPI0023F65726|nr:HNH endonuclease [Bifidobacterium sp. ESL0690]WEV46367.1 HNH endonuclease [Bifidobacterium sp. ESL0690]
MADTFKESGQGSNWTYEETKMAFALHVMLDRKECDENSSEVIKLAKSIGRTPAAVVLKIQNIIAGDPEFSGRGLAHGSKYDRLIWDEYFKDPDSFSDHCLTVLTNQLHDIPAGDVPEPSMLEVQPVFVGHDYSIESTQRYGQTRLRKVVFNNYHARCCLTGIAIKELLVVSHIKPWAVSNPTEKVKASNALLLNAFHDKAFDQGIITINQQFEVVVWDELEHSEANDKWLYSYAGKKIAVPQVGFPAQEFIDYHNRNIFKKPSQLDLNKSL